MSSNEIYSLDGHYRSDFRVQISKVLQGYPIGLKEAEKTWLVTFSKYDIGIIDKKLLIFESMEMQDG